MGEDNAGAAKPCRSDDDVPYRQFDRFRLSVIAFDVETPGRGVHMSDPQPLVRISFRPEERGEEAARGFLAVEDRWMLGALVPHAPNLFPVRLPT